MPLKPEFKAATLAALRSGNYEQNRGSIGNFERKNLCCIGVAAHANGLAIAQTTGMAANHIGLTREEKDQWVGWNDDEKLGFNEIADRIEAKYQS